MGDVRGFMKYGRRQYDRRAAPTSACKHYHEFLKVLPREELHAQGARCMDCGVPFCHTGCPLGNIIPDWNDLVYRDQWREALDRLHATNNFPEFTGRVCPAPCETACVLGINEDPGRRSSRSKCRSPTAASTKAGSCPSRPASAPASAWPSSAADRPAWPPRSSSIAPGHQVTVFERADRPGGLLMYGIPDFKLEKSRVWRRIEQMEAEGVEFRCNANVGVNVAGRELRGDFDAIAADRRRDAAARSADPRPRVCAGVHFAMEFLPQQNKRNQGDNVPGRCLDHWPPART